MQPQVIEEIAKHLGITVADIDPNASLVEDLGLGPVETADLLSVLTARFKVTFELDEIERLKTVNDVVMLIEDQILDNV